MSVIAAGCPQSESWLYTYPSLETQGRSIGSGKNGGESSEGERAPGKLLLANQFHNSFQWLWHKNIFWCPIRGQHLKNILSIFFLPPLPPLPPPPNPLPLPTIPKLWISSIKVRFWRPWFLNRLHTSKRLEHGIFVDERPWTRGRRRRCAVYMCGTNKRLKNIISESCFLFFFCALYYLILYEKLKWTSKGHQKWSFVSQNRVMKWLVFVFESRFEGLSGITITQTFSKCLPRGLTLVRKDVSEGTMGVYVSWTKRYGRWEKSSSLSFLLRFSYSFVKRFFLRL